MKNGDYTFLWNGKIYRFPTDGELDEWLKERAEEEEETTANGKEMTTAV